MAGDVVEAVEGVHAAQMRELLLSTTAGARVHRELWCCGGATYSAYRAYLKSRQQAGGGAAQPGGALRLHSSLLLNVPATAKYSFEGVTHVFDDSKVAVSCVSFGTLRNDLLAFANVEGELWFVTLHVAEAPHVLQAPRVHRGAITSICFSFDNSQTLTVGQDGALAVWRVADGACIRTLRSRAGEAFLCGRFHKVNPSLALVGTSSGCIDVYNCSTGTLHSRHQVFGRFEWEVQVTAIDCSNHHVFSGDSSGVLHLHKCELAGRQLSRLAAASRLSLLAPGCAASAVTSLEYVPFCRTTDTPILAAALRDGSLCIVKVHESRGTAELYLRRAVPPTASPLRQQPALCPLSCIQDVPLLTLGLDDTSVYIYDLAAAGGGSSGGGGGGHGHGLGGGGGAGAGGASRPTTVTVLKAHRAGVTAASWAYDESLLASADAEGTVVLWRRTALF